VGATPEETAKLTKENECCATSSCRERQEEARRDQRKVDAGRVRQATDQIGNIDAQTSFTGQPVTRLTTMNWRCSANRSFRFLMTSRPRSRPASLLPKNGSRIRLPLRQGQPDSWSRRSALRAGRTDWLHRSSIFKPNVPRTSSILPGWLRRIFDKGKISVAEKFIRNSDQNAEQSYSLSNLGVVYFRSGKLKAAELTLKKAVALSPKDEFTHTTLGIVYYRQSKFDER